MATPLPPPVPNVLAGLAEKLGATRCSIPEPDAIQPWGLLAPEVLVSALKFLRDTPGYYFDLLECLTAVDYHGRSEELGVVYHVCSVPYGHRIVLKVTVPRSRKLPDSETPDPSYRPSLPSVGEVYRTAWWHEREAYDLFGLHFDGHPDLRRLFMPEDWNGHPMRKDYQSPDTFHDIAVDY